MSAERADRFAITTTTLHTEFISFPDLQIHGLAAGAPLQLGHPGQTGQSLQDKEAPVGSRSGGYDSQLVWASPSPRDK